MDQVFDNFCKMLADYDSKESDFLITLTENFLWVRDFEYINYFCKAFENFVNSYDFSNNKSIFICPALPESDFGKAKSSVCLIYLIKAHLPAIQRKYQDFSITYVDSPDKVKFEYIRENNSKICLIDDFIGTGETALSATNYFLSKEINKEQLVILSLVSMKAGTQFLNDKGYTNYYAVQCNKGLSESGNDEYIEVMKGIEEKMKVKDKFKFGYQSSESLVKMMRTPNNTFPIYWCRKNNKHAPFPR